MNSNALSPDWHQTVSWKYKTWLSSEQKNSMTAAGHEPAFKNSQNAPHSSPFSIPYLALKGELWDDVCEDLGKNWLRYNSIALYIFSFLTILCIYDMPSLTASLVDSSIISHLSQSVLHIGETLDAANTQIEPSQKIPTFQPCWIWKWDVMDESWHVVRFNNAAMDTP